MDGCSMVILKQECNFSLLKHWLSRRGKSALSSMGHHHSRSSFNHKQQYWICAAVCNWFSRMLHHSSPSNWSGLWQRHIQKWKSLKPQRDCTRFADVLYQAAFAEEGRYRLKRKSVSRAKRGTDRLPGNWKWRKRKWWSFRRHRSSCSRLSGNVDSCPGLLILFVCLFVLLCFGVCLFGFSFVMICESSGRASHRELLRALKRHTRVWSQETQKTRNSFWIRWALHYKCFLHLKKEMFLIMFYPQIFREFLTNVLLPTSTKEPDVPACRKFVTEFAIQVLTNKMSKK